MRRDKVSDPRLPTTADFRRYGDVLVRELPAGAKFLVAREPGAPQDCLDALCERLCAGGLDVALLGELPAAIVDYARRRLHAAGSAVVMLGELTGSLPGLRWALGELPPSAAQSETVAKELAVVDAPKKQGKAERRPPTSSRTLDVTFDYVAWLQETWVESMLSDLHIVLDACGGVYAMRARRYLHAIFPHCLFSTIHDEPAVAGDLAAAGAGSRGDLAELLAELCDTVEQHRAHLGLAIDFHGDRLHVVDNRGVLLTPEELTCVLLRGLGAQLTGQQVVCASRLSNRVADLARELGAEPLMEYGRRDALCRRMAQTGALFGADADGHFFFRARGGGHDPLFAACTLIAQLAKSGGELADLRAACPACCITPELKIEVPAAKQQVVLEALAIAWDGYTHAAGDVLRIDTPGGWAAVVPEPGESAIGFRFEGLDAHALDHLVDRVCDSLGDAGDELWVRFEAMMGAADRQRS